MRVYRASGVIKPGGKIVSIEVNGDNLPMPEERRTRSMNFRMTRMAALVLAAVISGAPAFAEKLIDRSVLTGMLVPVTGEGSRAIDLSVPFARNSADLTITAERQLDELAAALAGERLRRFRVEVYGHTDASGSAEYNLKLSLARAAETVHYLVERHGLDRYRFRHGGYGEERLLTGLAPYSPRHRRVEIIVKDADLALPERTENKQGDGSDEKTPGEGGGLRAVQ